MDLLEGLNKVPWAELSHAYGSAADVPEMLQALVSDEEETRRRAISGLFANIYHQGTVYQASAYAVPFLITLVKHDQVQDRGAILGLLAAMAKGGGYIHQHLPLVQQEPVQPLEKSEEGSFVAQFQLQLATRWRPEQLYGPDYEQKQNEELFWVKKVHDAIVEGTAFYFALLEDPDIQVKMNAVALLACLPECAEQIVPLLYTLFEEEEDERIKGNILFALGMPHLQDERNAQFLDALVQRAGSQLLQFVAALIIVTSDREHIPYEAMDLLIEVAMGQIVIDEALYAQIPASEWKAQIAAFRALHELKPRPALYAFQRLLPAFRAYLTRWEEETGLTLQRYTSSVDFLMEMHPPESEMGEPDPFEEGSNFLKLSILSDSHPVMMMVEETSRTLVALAFGNERVKPGTRFHELRREQQDVLTMLLNCSLAWHCTGSQRDGTTGRMLNRITCVAPLDRIGLEFGDFAGNEQQEELRAFIEQNEGAGEALKRNKSRMREWLQRGLRKQTER